MLVVAPLVRPPHAVLATLTSMAADSGTIPREVLSWQRFGDGSRDLARTIVDDGFRPDVVVAIARGGLMLAGALAYAMGVKTCGALNVEFYTDVHQTLPEPVVLPPMLDGPALEGKRVLLVDDVSDSGRTLAMVLELLRVTTGAEVRSAVLYTKPHTIQEADYTWERTDRWIDFPWSSQPVITVA
jgi:hypoxanthine phosphoribosyltransferase